MKSDSTTKECYNAQIVTNNQIIVAADVTNQENDQNQLEPMVEQLKENISYSQDSEQHPLNHSEKKEIVDDVEAEPKKPNKLSAQTTEEEPEETKEPEGTEEKDQEISKIKLAADAGYNKGENLEYLDKDENIDAYVSMKNRKEEQKVEENPYHKDHFEYDEDEDTYTCPEKKTLEFQKDAIVNGKKVSYYACQ